MKKFLFVISVICVLVLSLGLSASDVLAAGSEWSSGTDVAINLDANPIPEPWLQLFGNGVKVNDPTQLCHSFREGAFGWTPVIYQSSENGWIALQTTNEKAGAEAENQACAFAPSAGTYALFAYFTKPDTASGCAYDTTLWSVYFWNAGEDDMYPGYEGYYLYATVTGLPEGTRVTYKLLEGFEGLTIAPQGTAFTYDYNDDGEYIYADFMASPVETTIGGLATFKITAAGCSFVDEIYINIPGPGVY